MNNMLRMLVSAVLVLGTSAGWMVAADSPHGASEEHQAPPVNVLDNEHDATLIVLDEAAKDVQRMRQTGQVDADRIEKMITFFSNFTDKCHHAKEERYLFPMLRGQGGNDAILDVVVAEHDMGRNTLQLVSTLLKNRDQMEGDQVEELAQRLEDFVELMRDHIRKENNQLWPAAREQLTQEQMNKLSTAFHVVEVIELGEGFHEKYHQIAMDLKTSDE